jgi:sugar O-acyltransferase (sialic acid O-acetyltransferase NeuD family)
MNATRLRIPLLNANEREALLAGLHVREGQQVKAGDVLYTLETTKSIAEVEAESDGYVVAIRVREGQQVSAGDAFAYLADQADWQPESEPEAADTGSTGPADLRITQPARGLAEKEGLDLATLPTDVLVTEGVVREILAASKLSLAEPDAFDDEAILVYGGGGHGKSLIELIQAINKYRIVGIIDDGLKAGDDIFGIPVLGGAGKLTELYSQGIHLAVNAVGGIGDVSTRVAVFERIKAARFSNPSVVHPTSFIEASARLADGTQVFPLAYVGSDVRTGFGSIINTGAILSHDCTLGDFTNIAPGAILAGGVSVGAGTLVGMGVTINLNVTIGERCLIGNGATVKSDVPNGTIVRAGGTWPA